MKRVTLGAVVLALVAVACGGGAATMADGAAEPAGSPVPAMNATQAPLLPTDVMALPSFDFGRFQELMGQLRGTPVVVNIWASWCGPCRLEAPDLARAANLYGDRVQFLGVDILDARGPARDFIREFSWPYPHLFDVAGEIRDRLGFIGQPATVIFDAQGNRVFEWNGVVVFDQLEENIEPLLA